MLQLALMEKACVTLLEDYWFALSFLLIPLFGPLVIFSVLGFSFYSVLQIRSTVPAQNFILVRNILHFTKKA